jgi:hypothetical protein
MWPKEVEMLEVSLSPLIGMSAGLIERSSAVLPTSSACFLAGA